MAAGRAGWGYAFGVAMAWHGAVFWWLTQSAPAMPDSPPRPVLQFEMATLPPPPPPPPPPSAPPVEEVVPPLPPPPAPLPAEMPKPDPPVRKAKPVKPPRKVPAAQPVTERPAEPVAAPSAPVAAPPAPPAPVEEVYHPPDVRAAYANNPKPAYPPSARRMGQQGTVLLTVEVSASGEVARVEVKSGSGVDSLDRAALAAVEKWRFVPARRNGQPVAATVTVPIRFQLDA
ncbi:MAG: energy transducer TonB [Magnetococcales bacterium]|nr:energy transducer TonB [Magnetococcales bacterium]